MVELTANQMAKVVLHNKMLHTSQKGSGPLANLT